MQFSKQDCLFSLMWKHSRKVQNVVLTKLLRGKSRIICWVSSENLLEEAECGFVVKGRDHLLTNLWERQASHQTEKLENLPKTRIWWMSNGPYQFPCEMFLQELISSKPDQRNWKGIGIALCCIVAILCTVALRCLLINPPKWILISVEISSMDKILSARMHK